MNNTTLMKWGLAVALSLVSGMAIGQTGNPKLVPVNKYGFADESGQVVIPLQYDDAKPFSEGLAAVAIGRWYDAKWGFIDEKGKMVIDIQFLDAESFSDGLCAVAVVTDTLKWGYIDKAGKWVIQPQFDRAEPFNGNIASIRVGDWSEGKWGCIDRTGKIVIQPTFKEPVFFRGGLVADVETQGTKRIINNTGKTIVDLPGDSYLYFYDDFTDGWGRVEVDEKVGLLNGKGWILKPEYESMSLLGDYCVVQKDDENGGIWSKSGKWLIEPKQGLYITSEDSGVLSVGLNDSFGLLNDSGWIVEPKYDYMEGAEGLFVFRDDDRCGFMDKTGKIVIEPQYESAEVFSEGLAVVVVNGKYGYIDKTGKLVIEPRFSGANSFRMGLAPVEDENSKWGYIDKTGKMVIAPRFDAAGRFDSDGEAWVRIGDFETGKAGYIDLKGNFQETE